MDELLGFILTPLVLGFLGGCLTLLGKLLLIDFWSKGYFARKRRELRLYEAIYDSISMCEMRYSLGWRSEIINLMKGKPLEKKDQREFNANLKTAVLQELMKMYQHLKWLDEESLASQLVGWERNIQIRIERQQKLIDEEKPSAEEDQAIEENPSTEILTELRTKIRKLTRYDY